MRRLIGPSSRRRKAQRLAAAAHVDRDKAVRAEATGCAIALLADLELALARAKLLGPAPVQRLFLDADGPVVGVNSFGEAKDLLGLAGDIGMQAFSGIDAVPAAT